MIAKKVNALCIACHDAQKDPKHVTPIAAEGHPLGGNLNDPKREGRDFSCASCHNPHGSDNAKLFYYGATPMESCAWCHGDKSGQNPELKNVIPRAKRASATPRGGAGGANVTGAGAGSGSAPGVGSGSGSGSPGDAPDAPRGVTP